jgi:hypothetical protein
MHEDLNTWLDEVWAKRVALLAKSKQQGYVKGRGASAGFDNDAVWEVYQMYNASGGAAPSSADSHLETMRKSLVELEVAIGKSPSLQIGNKFRATKLGWMANADLDELKDKFFHYPKQGAARYRIYINTQPAARGSVFLAILRDHGLWKINGLSNAKLAGPDDPRADAIVIYLDTEDSMKAGLACIAEHHKTNRGDYKLILPKLITPATSGAYQLGGVGVAMEPPDFRLVSTGGKYYRRQVEQSFGSYRSELIFMALERTRQTVAGQSEQQRKTAFKNRVEKYFRRAGIDPDQPALQMPVDQLPELSSIKGWANTSDRKPL